MINITWIFAAFVFYYFQLRVLVVRKCVVWCFIQKVLWKIHSDTAPKMSTKTYTFKISYERFSFFESSVRKVLGANLIWKQSYNPNLALFTFFGFCFKCVALFLSWKVSYHLISSIFNNDHLLVVSHLLHFWLYSIYSEISSLFTTNSFSIIIQLS